MLSLLPSSHPTKHSSRVCDELTQVLSEIYGRHLMVQGLRLHDRPSYQRGIPASIRRNGFYITWPPLHGPEREIMMFTTHRSALNVMHDTEPEYQRLSIHEANANRKLAHLVRALKAEVDTLRDAI